MDKNTEDHLSGHRGAKNRSVLGLVYPPHSIVPMKYLTTIPRFTTASYMESSAEYPGLFLAIFTLTWVES